MAVNLGRMAITIPAPFHDARQNVELAKRAEQELGYPAIWMAETAGPDSFSLAGAMAVSTRTIEIGTAIVPVYNRTPAVLAMSAATLAQLSGDRFILGLGSSLHAIMGDWNGVDFRAPLGHVREIRRGDAPGARRQRRPISRASTSDRTACGSAPSRRSRCASTSRRCASRCCELAGEVGEGLIINFQPASAMPQILAAYRAGGAEGRARRHEATKSCAASRYASRTTARRRARSCARVSAPTSRRPSTTHSSRGAASRARRSASPTRSRASDRAGVAAAITDELVDRIAILGTPDECREQIAEFVAAGVTTPVLAPLATSPAEAVRMLEALAPART